MLPGITVKSLSRFPDERGFFTEIMKKNWPDIGMDDIVQANYSVSYPAMIRAWHSHVKGQVDYFVVLDGALKICAFDDESGELTEIISTGENIQIVRIPGHYWHGFKVIGDRTAHLVYFVNRLYETKDPDEVRRPWNDASIIPESINGNSDDPRCHKSWDWSYPPYK
jgi:dTDP-4-dehydrorhamnose 3,5-epimerase